MQRTILIALLALTIGNLKAQTAATPPMGWNSYNCFGSAVHEDEVRVHPAEPIAFRCDCDAARIVQVLRRYTPEERGGLADDDGIIRASCEFCGTVHQIAPDVLA